MVSLDLSEWNQWAMPIIGEMLDLYLYAFLDDYM